MNDIKRLNESKIFPGDAVSRMLSSFREVIITLSKGTQAASTSMHFRHRSIKGVEQQIHGGDAEGGRRKT